MIDPYLGTHWGDEGKGRFIDQYAKYYDIGVRFQGGPNAGHTVVTKNGSIVLHTIPTTVLQLMDNVLGGNLVIDPRIFKQEIERLQQYSRLSLPELKNRISLSKRANLILPTHPHLDKAAEAIKHSNGDDINTTKKGIGPTYMDKTGRNGLKIGDIHQEGFKERYEKLKDKHAQLLQSSYTYELGSSFEEENCAWIDALDFIKQFTVIDESEYLLKQISHNSKIIAEGAQGHYLDLDLGNYPFVTSSNTSIGGVMTGLGVPATSIGTVYGICKAYCTRVGNGPFPTEINGKVADHLQNEGKEFGATTGRARRCGWLDLVTMANAIRQNGIDKLMVTKLDILDGLEEIKVAVGYQLDGGDLNRLPFGDEWKRVIPVYESLPGWKENGCSGKKTVSDLPYNARQFLRYISENVNTKIVSASVGAARDKVITVENL